MKISDFFKQGPPWPGCGDLSTVPSGAFSTLIDSLLASFALVQTLFLWTITDLCLQVQIGKTQVSFIDPLPSHHEGILSKCQCLCLPDTNMPPYALLHPYPVTVSPAIHSSIVPSPT